MQTLERFWHWHRNERPAADVAGMLLQKNLSRDARLALDLAMRHIAERALPRTNDDWSPLMPALERLSLAYCRAQTEMREDVPLHSWDGESVVQVTP